MKLRNVRIDCYRRFSEPNNVRLNENLIAVVGPNEAGKSSFLDALEELNNNEPISEYDATRNKDCQPEISATFSLDSNDRTHLNHIDGSEKITEWTLTKRADGDLNIALESELEHDLSPRKYSQSSIEKIKDLNVVKNGGGSRKANARKELLNKADTYLRNEDDFLGEEPIKDLEKLSSSLIDLAKNSDEVTDQEDLIINVGEELKSLAKHEEKCSPKRVRDILNSMRPQFVSFDEDDRQLQNTYDLDSFNKFPPALENLADIANLDLSDLHQAAKNGNRSQVYTLTNDASENLKSEFSKSWVQEEVVPIIDMDGTVLHLHVQTQDEEGHSPIEERSDGLRWFIALLGFLNSEDAGKNPILLVDEAEQHLSYDAQASLIEVLESQEIAQKVIYTTHSAGCLPSDLGTGIRPILPDKNQEKSTIENGFWKEGEGFSPLMIAMGLRSFAFTVSRNSLIGEGPCECILLPSMLRQAAGKDDLKYQVAPGASSVGSDSLGELLSESGRTAFIVDGDTAGDDLKDELVDAGAESDQIVSYNDYMDEPLVLEDFVDPEVYVEAINEELEEWQNADERIEVSDLPEYRRDNAVRDWCEDQGLSPVQKTLLCQRLAEKAANGESILESDREVVLEEVDSWVMAYFDIDQEEPAPVL